MADSTRDSIELLNTIELNFEIEKMLRNENRFILILSPYLDIPDKIRAIFLMSSAEIVVLYRELKQENKKIDELKESMSKVKFYCIQDFHAKAYITSGTMIITSLNLYEHSLIKNFELGILLKDNLYNKLIWKLSEELKLLFRMNNFDTEILDKLKLPTVNNLFNEILVKIKKKETDYPDAELFRQFSLQMLNKYNFDRKDLWKNDESMLQRFARVNQSMYEWALENISL